MTAADCEAAVAQKDRLYRALEPNCRPQAALRTTFGRQVARSLGASFDVLLYDLTSSILK